MGRKAINQFAFGSLPKSPMKLKELPLENDAGERLCMCSDCKGSGQHGTARKTETNASGVEKEVIAKINGNTVKGYRGLNGVGWLVDLKTCVNCNGAGMVKVQS